MKTILLRCSLTLTAILFGTLLLNGLSFMGKASSGPIEDVLTNLSGGIASLEKEYILDSRQEARSKKLKWFSPIKNNIDSLVQKRTILWGAYDNNYPESFEGIVELENKLETTFPLIHIYAAWGTKSSEQFPLQKTRAICNLGSTPVITWEPWLNSFEEASVSNPNLGGMKAVASGKYDAYIRKWAQDVKKLNETVFIRLGHEMNDPYRYPWGPQNNTPQEFISAWKHVVDLFREENATKVRWVWSPHPAYENYLSYYPGNNYVDWVGTGVLNYGTVANWSKWWSFDEIFYKFYNATYSFNKPIMITELASLAIGGSRADWYTQGLKNLPQKYPLVKSLIFYHSSQDNTTTNKSLDWQLVSDSASVVAIKPLIKL